jgi:L-aspartate oxidase
VLVDANGRSTLEGLWVCGESASTGAHGANRLASNSLLEAVVFAARIADDIAGTVPSIPTVPTFAGAVAEASLRPDPAALTRLRQAMTADVGVVRTGAGLARALATIARLEASPSGASIRNPHVAAKLIAASALRRTESRGAHYRADHPLPDPAQAVRSHITLAEADRLAADAGETPPAGIRALAPAD